MRRKFSDLGAERFLLTGLVPGPGLGGAWRAMADEVVERNRVDVHVEGLPKRLRRENNDAMLSVFLGMVASCFFFFLYVYILCLREKICRYGSRASQVL